VKTISQTLGMLGVVAHACNSSTPEAEVGGLRILGRSPQFISFGQKYNLDSLSFNKLVSLYFSVS
jgi:hypothetical protein